MLVTALGIALAASVLMPPDSTLWAGVQTVAVVHFVHGIWVVPKMVLKGG